MADSIVQIYIAILIILNSEKANPEMLEFKAKFLEEVTFSETLSTTIAESLIYCTFMCLQIQSCMSISYNSYTKECSLYPLALDPSGGSHSSVWRYYNVYTDKCSPDGGYYENRELNICYKVYPQQITCNNARSLCAADEVKMIKINTAEKQLYMEMLVASHAIDRAFIGGYREGTSWYYDDGSPMTYTHWDIPNGQPDNNAECISILFDLYKNYKWHDVYLNSSRWSSSVICEK